MSKEKKKKVEIQTQDDFLKSFDSNELSWDENDLKQTSKLNEDFDRKCRQAIIKAQKQREKQDLKKIKEKYGKQKKKKKLIDLSTTTKQIMLFLIINCTVVEVYAMFTMYHFQDLTTLEALISAVITETIAFLVYCVKSYFETRSEKMHELNMSKLKNQNSYGEDSPTYDENDSVEDECNINDNSSSDDNDVPEEGTGNEILS
jgi:membrane glycosyltransferase